MMKHKARKLRSHAALDETSRILKAKRILSALDIENNKKRMDLLDIGTGSGHIPSELGKKHNVKSVDVNDERVELRNYDFYQVESAKLPFPDSTFDVVVSNQVIEHIPEQKLHIAEIYRVLKVGGVAYIATPNRLWFQDPHTRLVGVTWVPRRMAHFYSRIAKRGDWDVFPVTTYRLKRHFKLHDIIIRKNTFDLIDSIHADSSVSRKYKFAKKAVPTSVLKRLVSFYPSIIFVVEKK